jgi:mono/diheme cytochrome c family protein
VTAGNALGAGGPRPPGALVAPRRAVGLVLLALAACRLPSPFGPDEREEGRRIYLRACASCHGEDARGLGAVAPALNTPPPDLTTLAARHGGEFPRAYVVEVITGERDIRAHGTRDMPVWSLRFGQGVGALPSLHAQRQLEMLADYLASLQR